MGPMTGAAVGKDICGDCVGGVVQVVAVISLAGFHAVGLTEGEASNKAQPLVHPSDDRHVLRSASQIECAFDQEVNSDPV